MGKDRAKETIGMVGMVPKYARPPAATAPSPTSPPHRHTIPGSVGKLGAREPEAKKMRWNKCLARRGDRKACLCVVLHVSGLLSGGAMAGGRRGKARGGEVMRAREKGLKVGE